MYYEKRYLQFNNLVFDGLDMLSDYDGDISFKGSSTEYSYGHGAYRPLKNSYLYVSEQTVSMTLTFRMKKMRCEHRPFYVRFAKEELTRPGKLWAIENNELMWANAVATSISPNYSRKEDIAVYDVSFSIPGGVWHKADKQKTFLVPYDSCEFMECKGYRILNPCGGVSGECCDVCEDNRIVERDACFCCCTDELTEDMQLCHHLNDLQGLYGCNTPWQIVWDCDHAEMFSREKFLGQKLCKKDICDDSVIAGMIYSETDIPTEEVSIIIDGVMNSPYIIINGNKNIIEGEYEGVLEIKSSGDIIYTSCDGEETLSPEVWTIPEGNIYGWTINPGNNSVVVYLNSCCSNACVYIQHDAITI